MKRLFPLFLKLTGRKCLVVGAGKIAESKITSLLDTEAVLHVVAPQATKKVQTWARRKRLHWHKRRFRGSDLSGCFLVIAATSSTKLHRQIFQSAKRRHILCNVVDVPDLCDFYYPAVVRRGSLQIAVSTGGESPSLAQRLRKELEAQFRPEYEEWVAQLGQERHRIRTSGTSGSKAKERLHRIAADASFQEFLKKVRK